MNAPSPRPSAAKAWLLATRPKTLTAASVPVITASALAAHDGVFRALPALAALLGAMFIQIGTNLVNDYFDFKRGADTTERLGPARATAQGWMRPETVIRAAMLCFGLAFITGIYLVWVAGWPIVVIGLLSLLSGYAYTGGPYPLAYHGLGDIFVLVFFGPMAVLGTYFVQAGTITSAGWVLSFPVGALATCLLIVNNLRDIPTDIKANKRTMAVRLGPSLTRAQYVLFIALSVLTPLALWQMGLPSSVLLACAAVVPAVVAVRMVLTLDGAPLNNALAATARVHLIFGALITAGLLL
jgi:1,4-dihydroxy-2-naphthoate octaprenyltransferase